MNNCASTAGSLSGTAVLEVRSQSLRIFNSAWGAVAKSKLCAYNVERQVQTSLRTLLHARELEEEAMAPTRPGAVPSFVAILALHAGNVH